MKGSWNADTKNDAIALSSCQLLEFLLELGNHLLVSAQANFVRGLSSTRAINRGQDTVVIGPYLKDSQVDEAGLGLGILGTSGVDDKLAQRLSSLADKVAVVLRFDIEDLSDFIAHFARDSHDCGLGVLGLVSCTPNSDGGLAGRALLLFDVNGCSGISLDFIDGNTTLSENARNSFGGDIKFHDEVVRFFKFNQLEWRGIELMPRA